MYMYKIYTIEYYTAFRNKEIFHCASALMNLENIILSKISPVTDKQVIVDSIHMSYMRTSNSGAKSQILVECMERGSRRHLQFNW